MTPRQIIIKALDEETELTCCKYSCDKPEKEGNTGKRCHKCALEILREFENKIYNQALKDFIKKAKKERDDLMNWDADEYENGMKAGYQYSIEIAEELKKNKF